MTPALRQLIERAVTSPDAFGLSANLREAIIAQRDELEIAEQRVIQLRAACDHWESVVEQHGHRVDPGYDPGMDHHKQALEPDHKPNAEQQV